MNDRVMALRVGIVLLAAGFITGFLIILLGEGRNYLQGRYTVDSGLTALLAQSRLTYRWINSKTVEIIPLRTAPSN